MEFIPLFYGNKLNIINPHATLGLVCLWSSQEYVLERLRSADINLNPKTSKIAVIGNLFGNGIPQMLRNLLYNPQITDIVIFGSDRSGSAEHLRAFFKKGLETAKILGKNVTRIAGTEFVIDDAVTPEMFDARIRIYGSFGKLQETSAEDSAPSAIDELKAFLDNYPAKTLDGKMERLTIPMPVVEMGYFPGEPASHCIVRESPLDAWRELIFRIARFGHISHLRKGDRQEIQNLKVVITKPEADSDEALREYGFNIAEMEEYQRDMLNPSPTSDHPYTYGNRIGKYFGFDALERFSEKLTANPEDRDCYLSLWDSKIDIDAEDSPCLVSLFFRVFDQSLTLTAVYRTHNALDAWLKNIYGLMAVQKVVSEKIDIKVGTLTVVSQSISIDPNRYDFAKRICSKKGFEVNLDPNGYFTFAVENGNIVAQHLSPDGQMLKEYKSPKPEVIQHEIYRDCAISDIGHAIYVGRQLARAHECLISGQEFVEQ